MDQATLVINTTANEGVSEPTITITLQGSWTVGSAVPGTDQLAVLASDIPVNVVAFTASDNFAWDSRLLAWLMAAQRQLGTCSFDLNGLPGEVAELFQLANTVPASQAQAWRRWSRQPLRQRPART